MLIMELALFIYLLVVLCKLNKFLKSFDHLRLGKNEIQIMQRSKGIFICFTINLGVMMIIDAAYSVFDPVVWLREILTPQNDTFSVLYDCQILGRSGKIQDRCGWNLG